MLAPPTRHILPRLREGALSNTPDHTGASRLGPTRDIQMSRRPRLEDGNTVPSSHEEMRAQRETPGPPPRLGADGGLPDRPPLCPCVIRLRILNDTARASA